MTLLRSRKQTSVSYSRPVTVVISVSVFGSKKSIYAFFGHHDTREFCDVDHFEIFGHFGGFKEGRNYGHVVDKGIPDCRTYELLYLETDSLRGSNNIKCWKSQVFVGVIE